MKYMRGCVGGCVCVSGPPIHGAADFGGKQVTSSANARGGTAVSVCEGAQLYSLICARHGQHNILYECIHIYMNIWVARYV